MQKKHLIKFNIHLWFKKNSFSALIAVAKTSKTMLNSSGESGHPCLVPDFRGNAFNFSPLRIMFAVGLAYMAFSMLRYVPSMPAFWRVFIINGCWILSKAFFASIEIIIWYLSFNLLMWCITLIDLWILKNPCIPGIKPTGHDVWTLTILKQHKFIISEFRNILKLKTILKLNYVTW